MITKKYYTIYKLINIKLFGNKYYYDELVINVCVVYLFGFIPIFKTQQTIEHRTLRNSYVKPKIQKLY